MKQLSDKQQTAARLLASGQLGREVAEAVEVAPPTLSLWRGLPEFMAYYNALRNEIHLAARDALRARSVKAVDTLGDLLRDEYPPETRRRAARDILDLMGHGDLQSYYLEVGCEDATLLGKN